MYSCLDEAWESPFQQQYKDLHQLYKVENSDKSIELSKQGIQNISFYTSQGEYIPSKKEIVDCDEDCQAGKNITPVDMSPIKTPLQQPDEPDIFDFVEDDYPDLHPRYEKFCLSKKKKKKCQKVHTDCGQHMHHITQCEFCQKNLKFLTDEKHDWTDWFKTTETKYFLKVVFIVLICILALDILSPLRKIFHRR